MNELGIQNGMTVYSSDGEKLGKVVSCDADGFLVEKGFFFPKEHFVRYEHAISATGDEIRLSIARDELTIDETSSRPPPIEREHETYGGALGTSGQDELRTTLSEEQLEVLKRQREKGEVRLQKDVVTETKHMDVPVTREEVRVERAPIGAPREAVPGEASFKRETQSMPLREEEVEIRKRPVVKEEVRVKRDRVQYEQRADAEVRRETADIEDESGRTRDVKDTTGGLGAPGRDDDLIR